MAEIIRTESNITARVELGSLVEQRISDGSGMTPQVGFISAMTPRSEAMSVLDAGENV